MASDSVTPPYLSGMCPQASLSLQSCHHFHKFPRVLTLVRLGTAFTREATYCVSCAMPLVVREMTVLFPDTVIRPLFKVSLSTSSLFRINVKLVVSRFVDFIRARLYFPRPYRLELGNTAVRPTAVPFVHCHFCRDEDAPLPATLVKRSYQISSEASNCIYDCVVSSP